MSAAIMSLTVELSDGTVDSYDVRPVTVVAFERQFGKGIASLSDDAHMEYIYWLAWHSSKTAGKVVKPFDGWLEGVASVDLAASDPLE